MLQWTLGCMFFFRHMPRSGIARSYGSSIFSFLRNLHTVPIYFSTSSIGEFPFPTSSPAFTVEFLMIASLTGERWYSIVILICISLIISDVVHLFLCLLSICMSSLEKYLFLKNVFCPFFFIALFVFLNIEPHELFVNFGD